MFRYRSGIKVDYDRQGYIYFISRLFDDLSYRDKEKIRKLCEKCAGEEAPALLEYVTTDASATAICIKHYVSKSNLYRAVRKYYENFPDKL